MKFPSDVSYQTIDFYTGMTACYLSFAGAILLLEVGLFYSEKQLVKWLP